MIVVSIVYLSCASTGSGFKLKKDVLPPVLDTIKSTKNYQVNYKPQLLTFYFDEFVEVKDPLKQVIVSPPLVYLPEVKNRGKKVTFKFNDKEILKDDLTYTINFGEAIVDFHEGNKLANFNFVFATGSVIDSMSISGSVTDVLTQKPTKDMVMMLYDKVTYDSIVAKEKPYYFCKVNEKGDFVFTNIKSGTYLLFALKDENLNYIYDLPNEKIGFLDELVDLDTIDIKGLKIVTSLPTPSYKILSKDTKTYGIVTLKTNAPTPPNYFLSLPDSIRLVTEEVVTFNNEVPQYTTNLYYESALDSFQITSVKDTIIVKPKNKDDFLKKSKFKQIASNASQTLTAKDSVTIGFNFPIKSINFQGFNLKDGIGDIDDAKYSISEDKKSLIIKYAWEAGETYNLNVDSAAISSIYGLVNDSFPLKFSILESEKLAALKLVTTELDSTQQYIFSVLRENSIVTKVIISGQKTYEIELNNVIPARYDLEITEDTNRDGQWSPGNYWQKFQPETTKLIRGDKIRENWETILNISWRSGSVSRPDEPSQNKDGLDTKPPQNKK